MENHNHIGGEKPTLSCLFPNVLRTAEGPSQMDSPSDKFYPSQSLHFKNINLDNIGKE